MLFHKKGSIHQGLTVLDVYAAPCKATLKYMTQNLIELKKHKPTITH